MSLSRQLFAVPPAGDTLEAASLGHTDAVNHLILLEDLIDRHLRQHGAPIITFRNPNAAD